MMRHRHLALAILCLLPRLAVAAPPGADPGWPCRQPLVTSVSAAMIWDGPPLDHIGDWRSEPAVSALVAKLASEDVSIDAGKAAIARFLRSRLANRRRSISRAFAGLLEESNQARMRAIDDIEMLGQRQRSLADVIAGLTAEKDKAGASAAPDLVERWNFARQTYYQAQRTILYACEMPAGLDQRLGVFARELRAGLP